MNLIALLNMLTDIRGQMIGRHDFARLIKMLYL